MVDLSPGPQSSTQIPSVPEKYQWTNRCPPAEQTLRQLLSSRTAGPTTWRHFTERQVSRVHFRWSRKQRPSSSGVSWCWSEHQIRTDSHGGHMVTILNKNRAEHNWPVWMWVSVCTASLPLFVSVPLTDRIKSCTSVMECNDPFHTDSESVWLHF